MPFSQADAEKEVADAQSVTPVWHGLVGAQRRHAVLNDFIGGHAFLLQ